MVAFVALLGEAPSLRFANMPCTSDAVISAFAVTVIPAIERVPPFARDGKMIESTSGLAADAGIGTCPGVTILSVDSVPNVAGSGGGSRMGSMIIG